MKYSFAIIFFLFSATISTQAQSSIDNQFFEKVDAFMKSNVKNGQVDYANLTKDKNLSSLVGTVATAKLNGLDSKTKQAFYINAYNLLVIKGAIDNYPLSSVLKVNGFFDAKKVKVAGESITLNQLEKDKLLKTYKDSRFHFVLVCGANGCPPITDFAYMPAKLEEQLEQQTRKALNDNDFIKVNNSAQTAQLSQIFNWYKDDFGGNKSSAIDFINKYRSTKIPASYKVSFYEYDWSLNTQGGATGSIETNTSNSANDNRYVVSAAIPKGTTETKIFNNLYTERTGNGEQLTDRSTFFTTSLSFLYGVSNRFNAGIDMRYRRVNKDAADTSPFAVLGNPSTAQTRQGITSVGPKIRWAPTSALPNFSIQSTFSIPVGKDLEGTADEPYIDWDGSTWWTQFFNDFTIGDRFSLFSEVDVLIEDIGDEADLNRFSTPVTAILSFFPNPKTTLYVLGSYSPYWQKEFDYFAQAGVGAKYQVSSDFEIELLYTGFTNGFLQSVNGQASTFNIGFRYSK